MFKIIDKIITESLGKVSIVVEISETTDWEEEESKLRHICPLLSGISLQELEMPLPITEWYFFSSIFQNKRKLFVFVFLSSRIKAFSI